MLLNLHISTLSIIISSCDLMGNMSKDIMANSGVVFEL